MRLSEQDNNNGNPGKYILRRIFSPASEVRDLLIHAGAELLLLCNYCCFFAFLSAGDTHLLNTMIKFLNAALALCLAMAVNGFVVPSPAAFSSRTASLAKATYSQVCRRVRYIASLYVLIRRCQCGAKYIVSASRYVGCAVSCRCSKGLRDSLAVPPCLHELLHCSTHENRACFH